MALIKGEEIDRVILEKRESTLRELGEFCAQPGISAQNRGINEMVQLVVKALEKRGFATQIIPTANHPAVIAERKGKSDRAILFYNHYDVQPPDPLEKWDSDPFELSVRDEKCFARGVMDDKGHLVCRLAAVDALLAIYGELPCTVKFIIEGEEEISSPNLATVIHEHQTELKADLCLWEFGEVDGEGVPMEYLGFRGNLDVELSVRSANLDAHSGIWGTLLPNAAWRLTWALSKLKDKDENILIPGFYERVKAPTSLDMELMSRLPLVSDEQWSALGAKSTVFPYSSNAEFHRNAIFRPSCNICGLTSGYQGEGQKTIIPAFASGKVDFRLVPDQTPDEILEKLKKYLKTEGFDDIEVRLLGCNAPARTLADDPLVQMVVESAREVYGQPQRVHPMSGGSGPAYLFTHDLGVPVVTVGVGYQGSNIHAPNENIRIKDFFNGIRHTARIIVLLEK